MHINTPYKIHNQSKKITLFTFLLIGDELSHSGSASLQSQSQQENRACILRMLFSMLHYSQVLHDTDGVTWN